MSRKLWLFAGAVTLSTLLAVVVVITVLNRALRRASSGFLGQSTTEWREILRKDGQSGHLSESLARDFVLRPAGANVLIECANDPDSNVRWPAVHLLGLSGPSDQATSVARRLLHDTNGEVRCHAALALGIIGVDARPALGELTSALQDPEYAVSWAAELAMWKIDIRSALAIGNWQKFTSTDLNFSAIFPEPLEQAATAEALSFGTSYKSSRFVVAVSEAPAELAEPLTSDELFDRGRDAMLAGLGGKLLSEEPYHQNGFPGREYVVEVAGKGTTRKRVLLVGRRLYQVVVTYSPQSFIPEAVDYFFDSFQIENPAP